MIRHRGKLKKKRFDKLKALFRDEERRLRFLGTIDYDNDEDFDEEYEYEADDEEYEDSEEELAAQFMDFGI